MHYNPYFDLNKTELYKNVDNMNYASPEEKKLSIVLYTNYTIGA